LCESEATATILYCAKAKRQQHGFICAKAQRQQQIFPVRKRSDSNNNNTRRSDQHHVGPKSLTDVTDFEEELLRELENIQTQLRWGVMD